jgi:MoaA/NifB/PqqE/SkfB family radical SAM enzyme
VSLLSRRREGSLMSMEVFERLEPWFSSTGLVFLQGWGEPLLHPRFWEMAQRARSAGAPVGFTTSGVHLDQANRRALLASGVEIMGVSLAGASPEVHDLFRPGCPLETVNANLQALRSEGEAEGTALPDLHLAYLLMAGNLHDLPRAVDLAQRWGAGQIVVSQLSPVLSAGLEKEALLARPDRWPQVEAVLDETRERAEERGIGFHAYGPGGGERPEPACTENVLASCFVSVRGDVSPCVMTNLGLGTGEEPGAGQGPERGGVIGSGRGLEPAQACGGVRAPEFREGAAPTHWFRGSRAPLPSLIFGNVREASLKEIWHSSAARRFREVLRERLAGGVRNTEGLPGPCIHCYKLFQR